MSHAPPCTSPWIDYTDSHRGIRKGLEEAIELYVRDEWKNRRPPVIVAPYGSGKTTLLRHLLCYSISKDIPVIMVNLSGFVSYLQSSSEKKNVHEDFLAGYMEQFCEDIIKCLVDTKNCPKYVKDSKDLKYVLKSVRDEFKNIGINVKEISNVLRKFISNNDQEKEQKCVLLIDEVEESYQDLKEVVSHKTTPLRGVFDKVLNGTSRVFPIFAFGPATVYSEAVSSAGSWRVEPLVLPLLSPLDIGVTDHYISNLVWWIGKGRHGHVHKVLEGITFDLKKTLSECKSLLGTEWVNKVKQTEIVQDAVSYIDVQAFSKIENELNDDERHLFYVLSTLIGPVPESELKRYKCIDVEKLNYSKLPGYFVKSYQLVNVNEALDAVEDALKKLGYKVSDFENDLIRSLLLAWSDHKKIILDRRGLSELIDIAKDMSVELFAAGRENESLVDALSRLDVDSIYIRLEGKAERTKEPYYALSPSAISQIYPPILLNPLIGCAKKKSLDDIYKELVNNIDIPKLVTVISREFQNELNKLHKKDGNGKEVKDKESEDKKYRIILVFGTLANKEELKSEIKKLFVNEGIRGIILVPVIYGQNLEVVIDNLRKTWEKYERLGLVKIIDNLSPRIILFLIGLVYNIINNCDLGQDEKAYELFMDALTNLINESIDKLEKADLRIAEDLKAIGEIEKYAYTIGTKWTEYLLYLASSNHKDLVEKYLIELMKSVNDAVDSLTKLIDIAGRLNGRSIQSRSEITSGFGELLKNRDTFENLKLQIDEIFKNSGEYLDYLIDVINDLSVFSNINTKTHRNKKDGSVTSELVKGLNKITETITSLSGMRASLISWLAIQSSKNGVNVADIENICSIKRREILNKYQYKFAKFNEDAKMIYDLTNSLRKMAGGIRTPLVESLEKLGQTMSDANEGLRRLWEYLDECGSTPEGLTPAEKLLLLDFFFKLVGNLFDNVFDPNSIVYNQLDSMIKDLNDILSVIKNIELNLNKLNRNEINEEAIQVDKINQAVQDDFRNALNHSDSVNELKVNLEMLNKLIESLSSEIVNVSTDQDIKRYTNSVIKKVNEINKKLLNLEKR